MPKIQQNSKGGKIIWDSEDWIAGIEKIQASSGYWSKGNGFTASGTSQIDTLRNLGYLTVGFHPVDVTGIAQVTGLIKNGVIKGDEAYLVATDKIHKLGTLTAGTISTTAPFPHTIDHAHASETGSDCVNYYVGSTLYLFYSFYDTTDWDVGAYGYVADAFNYTVSDDYMSTKPATPLAGTDLTDGKSIEHPLIVGDDDILYMGSGRYVHAFDGQTGANGTFYSKVLTLPVGWYISCFAKFNGKLAIGAYYSSSQGASTFNKGEAKVFTWNYLDLEIENYYALNDNYISELFNWNGTLACFTDGVKSISKLGTKKLQIFDGSKFSPIVEWNSGSLPIRGGVDIIGTDIYWNSSGNIYCLAKIPNTDVYSLNFLDGISAESSGMLKFFTQLRTLHFSTGTGAGAGLRYFGSNYGEAGAASCKPAFLGFQNNQKGKITSVAITYLEAVTGGRALTWQIETDEGAKTILDGVTTVTDLKVKYMRINDGSDFGTFTRIQPSFSWSSGSGATKAPTIERIEVEFELTNI